MKKLRRIFFVLVAVLLVSCTVANVGAAAVNFTDTDNHWAWTGGQIPYLVDKGVLNGYPDNTFKPDNQVKRAEFIKMLDETFGLTATKAISFSDIDADDWYNVYFQKAAAQGYLLNYGTKANPEGLISREEAISLLVRYLNLDKDQKASTSTFTDYATINANYRDYVLEAIYAGLINGYEQDDGTYVFKPQKTLSRAEALTILYRAAGCIYNKTSFVRDNGAPDTNSVITTGGVTIQDQTLTGRVIISEGASSDIVTFSNCRITGTLYIRGNTKVYFDKCTVNDIVINGTGGISLLTNTTVNKIDANSNATLSITKGTKVNTLNVNASATGANVIGDGEIDKLAVRCANFTSSIMPGEYEIFNGHTATLAGTTYSGSTDNSGIFTVAPYVTADKTNYYLEFTATKAGTAYYYFTNSTVAPSVDDFDKAYVSADVQGRVAAKANEPTVATTGTLAALKNYRYVVVMFQSGTTKYNPVVVNNNAEANTGFTTEPYFSETDTSIKFKAGVAGTVYYYYTENGADLTQTQFLKAYNDTENALKGTVTATTRSVASISLNKTYAARYSYVAVMLKSSAGTNYTPVVVPVADDGFATLPAVQANGYVTFKTDVSGTLYYYYTKTAEAPTPAAFNALWRTATYAGNVNVYANTNGSFAYQSSYASVYPYLVVCVKDTSGAYKLPVVIELTQQNGFIVAPKFISDTQIAFTTENAGVVQYYFTTSSTAPADSIAFTQIFNYMPTAYRGTVNCYSNNYQGFIGVPATLDQTSTWYVVIMLTDRNSSTSYAPMILRVKYDPADTITGFVYQPYIKDGELYIKTAANTTVRYYYSKYTSAVTPAQFYSEYSAADSAYRGELYVQANDVRKLTIDPNARLLYRTIVVACYNGYAYSEPVVLNAFSDTPGYTGSAGFTYSVTDISGIKALSILPSYTGTLYYFRTDSLVVASASPFDKTDATAQPVQAGKLLLLNGDDKKYLVLALEANDRMYDTVVIDTTTWTQHKEEQYNDGANSQSTGFSSFVSISGGCSFTTSYDGVVYITLVGDGKVIPWNGNSEKGNVGYVAVKRGELAEFNYTGIMTSVLTNSRYSEYAHIYLYIQGFELPMTVYKSQVITFK